MEGIEARRREINIDGNMQSKKVEPEFACLTPEIALTTSPPTCFERDKVIPCGTVEDILVPG